MNMKCYSTNSKIDLKIILFRAKLLFNMPYGFSFPFFFVLLIRQITNVMFVKALKITAIKNMSS